MRNRGRGFTLIELIVVIGLIAGLAYFLMNGLADGGRNAALQSGQTTVANLLMAARTQAMAAGNHSRILVHHDLASAHAAERYLGYIALEELRDGVWHTLQTVRLPSGIYVVPHQNQTPLNLYGDAGPWVKVDGSRLHSSCLSSPLVFRAINTTVQESWAELVFSPLGTPLSSGFLVVGTGTPHRPGSFAEGAPIMLKNQDAVRGLQLSAYGLSLLINERTGF